MTEQQAIETYNPIGEESSNLNLENIVEESQERIFTTETAARIISEAQLLRSFEERRNEGDISQSVSEKYGSTLSAKALYQIGKDFGIETNYIDRIIEFRYPSEKQKTGDIIKFDSTPSRINQIAPIYIREIKKAVATQMPFDRLSVCGNIDSIHDDCWLSININRIKEEREIIEGKLFMPWRKKKEKITETEPVAIVHLILGMEEGIYRNLLVTVKSYDPVFLNKCGKSTEDIKRFFPTLNTKVNFQYNYNVDSK